MKLVAGLGNPGAEYRGTRHNVGFAVLDLLADRHALAFEASRAEALEARWRRSEQPAVLVKPLTFMNLSGPAVAELARYYRIAVDDVLVVCDDVHLPLGRLRARASGSNGGHNGLRSVAAALATTEYSRLRVGVGRGDERRDLAGHVLARFPPDEQPEVARAIARAADAVELWIDRGTADVMNTFNRALAADGDEDAGEGEEEK